MKHSVFLIIFILSKTFTQAQITSIVYPIDGTELQVISCDYTDPLANEIGPNAIWDYSVLPECKKDSWGVTFHSMEGSEEAEIFPDANKFLEIDIPPSTKIRIFNKVDDLGWSIYGAKYNTYYFYYNEGETILQYPAEIDDIWTNDNIWIDGNDTIYSTPEYTIDGQGTLILPNATYENVIRVHSVRPDAVGLFTEETYTYYSPNYKYHLFHMLVNDESQYQPNPPAAITSTSDLVESKPIMISPNPISGNSSFEIKLDIKSKASINLYSYFGQIVLSKKDAQFINGTFSFNSGKELPKGIYFLQVFTDEKRYVSRLIVQ